MKKIFMLLVAFATMLCVSCSDDDNLTDLTDDTNETGDNSPSGTIKMTVAADDLDDLYVYTYHEGDIVDVDWGDGRKSSYTTVCAEDDEWGTIYDSGELKHSYHYSSDGQYIATIKGNIKMIIYNEHIKFIDASQCPGLEVLWADLSGGCDSINLNGCTSLRELSCGSGNLTKLDIDDCSSLSYLSCYSNNLTSLSIPKNNVLKFINLGYNKLDDIALNTLYHSLPTVTEGKLLVFHNLGKGDPSIAEKKGWTFI